MVNYLNLKDWRTLSPLAGTLQNQGVNNYTITFKPTRYYSLHERLGIAFLHHVFDSLCLDFLTQNLDVFAEVLGYPHWHSHHRAQTVLSDTQRALYPQSFALWVT